MFHHQTGCDRRYERVCSRGCYAAAIDELGLDWRTLSAGDHQRIATHWRTSAPAPASAPAPKKPTRPRAEDPDDGTVPCRQCNGSGRVGSSGMKCDQCRGSGRVDPDDQLEPQKKEESTMRTATTTPRRPSAPSLLYEIAAAIKAAKPRAGVSAREVAAVALADARAGIVAKTIDVMLGTRRNMVTLRLDAARQLIVDVLGPAPKRCR